MDKRLIERRDRAWNQVSLLLDAHPRPSSRDAVYRSHMQPAIAELEAVYAEATQSNADRVELARTARALAGALTDLSAGREREVLQRACRIYEEASSTLGELDEIERAKLEFNYGITIQQIDANNVVFLEEAARRYQRALRIFTAKAPEHVGQVSRAIALLGAMLPIARLRAKSFAQLQAVESLKAFVGGGGDTSVAGERLDAIRGSDADVLDQFCTLAAAAKQVRDAVGETPASNSVLEGIRDVTVLLKGGPQGALFEALSQRLISEAASGNTEPHRLEQMTQTLHEFFEKLGSAHDLPGQMSALTEARAIARGSIDRARYLTHGLPLPEEGTRARVLIELFWPVRHRLLEEISRPNKPRGDSRRLMELIVKSNQIDRDLYAAANDPARARRCEVEQVRPFLVDVRIFARRRHAMIARPRWGRPRCPSPSNVFFSGRGDQAEQVAAACLELGLNLPRDSFAADYAADRFAQLSAASICVFDFGSAKGTELAQVAYETGIALSLGRTTVILAPEELPFDFDMVPVRLESDRKDAERIAAALDHATHWLPATTDEDHTTQMIAALERELALPDGDLVRIALRELEIFARQPDPHDAISKVEHVLAFAGDRAPSLIFPAWDPAAIHSTGQILFHVMPFREEWSNRVRDEAREICRSLGLVYHRGDEGDQREIIDAIWRDIATSSILLVDLTANNANVAFELGIADTLGRPTCLVMQTGQNAPLRSLSKQRTASYRPGDDSMYAALEFATRALRNTG